MTRAQVSQLAYVSLGVSDLDEWRRFGGCLGAEVVDSDAGGLAFRIDDRDARLLLAEAATESLEVVGWEVPSPDALEELVERARRHGVAVAECDSELAARRRYGRVVRLQDPAGMPLELACMPVVGPRPYLPSRPISGFKAGSLGLGHLFIYVSDIGAMERFYRDVLGFQTSDYITWPEADIDAVFLRCNSRHHSVAFAESTSSAPSHLEHVMLEVMNVDDVGLVEDVMRSSGFPLATSLGRHINDRMLSFYVRTPSGFWLEYGCGATAVEDDVNWEVKRYTNGHTWGHARVGPSSPQLLPFGEGSNP